MKQLEIIKKINKLFKENWTRTAIKYDDSEAIKLNQDYIYLKYIPSGTSQKFYGTNGVQTEGILRIFVYKKNSTKSMEELDELYNFLSNKCIENVYYERGNVIQGPNRIDNSDLFESAIDFQVSTL